MKKRSIILSLLTVILFTLSSCGKDNSELIIGKWGLETIAEGDILDHVQDLGISATYEYKSDGTYHALFTMEFYGELIEQEEDGSYTIDDQNICRTWVEDGETMTETDEIKTLDKNTLAVISRYTDGELGTIESLRTYTRL